MTHLSGSVSSHFMFPLVTSPSLELCHVQSQEQIYIILTIHGDPGHSCVHATQLVLFPGPVTS